ncbi:MAG TPA: superoxide dismutase, Ni [Patescibacteria group bacterium]|nr:superoxide dismutase, Ni [Patescibacteria group bacterium]
MLKKIFQRLPIQRVSGHCDAPCGVYDPAQARVTAEAVLAMTKKILALEMPQPDSKEAMIAYTNTLVRYIQVKEEQAQETKNHLLILWTDFFKAEHLEKFSDLHDVFWKAAKLCSVCKQEVSLEHAEELLDSIQRIHEMFWQAKGREVPWVQAVQ